MPCAQKQSRCCYYLTFVVSFIAAAILITVPLLAGSVVINNVIEYADIRGWSIASVSLIFVTLSLLVSIVFYVVSAVFCITSLSDDLWGAAQVEESEIPDVHED